MTFTQAPFNSATKYPSIETYHRIDPADGRLSGDTPAHDWGDDDVFGYEKVDGTNGRIIFRPGGDYFIGSREELLYAKGDRIENPALSVVPVLKPLADRLCENVPGPFSTEQDITWVYFLEVYGKGITGNGKQYSTDGEKSFRLFDVAGITPETLELPREEISSWRQHGGQQFMSLPVLNQLAAVDKIAMVPARVLIKAADLPQTVAGTHEFLADYAETRAALATGAGGRAEGLVFRTGDRSVIAKARFQDYERTLRQPRGRNSK